MDRRPKVYIPNKGTHDYSTAQQYGELVFITQGSINKFALDTIYRTAVACMADSSEDDYLIISSLNSLCSICAAILARKHGRLNFLLFRRDRYIERIINIDSLIRTSVNISEGQLGTPKG